MIAVEPGVGYAGTGDIAESRTVAYDDPEAVVKWVVAVVEVDELLSGVLTARQGNRVRVEFLQPDGVSLDVFQSRLSSLGSAVWLIDKSADVLRSDDGKTSPLDVFPAYAERTYRLTGDALFVEQADGSIRTPTWPDTHRDLVLRGIPNFNA